MLGLGFSLGDVAVRRRAVSASYDAASTAYFAAMSVQPDATRKGLIDALIAGLKADGVWALLDLLALPAAHDAQAGLLNAVNPAQALVKSGTMTFTTDRGYAGDGSTGYLSTPANDNGWSLFTLNSATLGVWVNSTGGSTVNIIGQATGGVVRMAPYTGANLQARLGSATAVTGAVADGLGFSCAVRSSSSTITSYRGSAQVATSAANTSTALAGDPILLNRQGAVYHPGRIAAFALGAALDATKEAALNTRLSTYLTAIGGN